MRCDQLSSLSQFSGKFVTQLPRLTSGFSPAQTARLSTCSLIAHLKSPSPAISRPRRAASSSGSAASSLSTAASATARRGGKFSTAPTRPNTDARRSNVLAFRARCSAGRMAVSVSLRADLAGCPVFGKDQSSSWSEPLNRSQTSPTSSPRRSKDRASSRPRPANRRASKSRR